MNHMSEPSRLIVEETRKTQYGRLSEIWIMFGSVAALEFLGLFEMEAADAVARFRCWLAFTAASGVSIFHLRSSSPAALKTCFAAFDIDIPGADVWS